MKVHIDRDNCTSCGTCWDTCPAFFEMKKQDGFSQVVEEFRLNGDIARGTPPDDLEACARDAADLCPVQIIHTME